MNQKRQNWLDDPEWNTSRKTVKRRQVGIDGLSYPTPPRKIKPVALDKPQSTQIQEPPKPTKNKENIQISFNLRLPKIKFPRISKRQKRNGLKIAAALAGLVILILGVKFSLNLISEDKSANTKGTSVEVPQTPQFKTVLPDRIIEATTSDKVGYDPERKVASFTDKVTGIDVTVSQQEIPEQFQRNPEEQVEIIAKSFKASEVVETKSGKAYIATTKEGKQTVVLAKKNLFIFINATGKVSSPDWIEYINSLQ